MSEGYPSDPELSTSHSAYDSVSDEPSAQPDAPSQEVGAATEQSIAELIQEAVNDTEL